MTPHSSPEAAASRGFVQTAASYGAAAPRPGLLMLVLLLIATCIVVLTAIDLATMSAQVAHLSSSAEKANLPADALRSSQLNTSLFIAAFMAGVLALITFGHNWARWVWMILCMLVGLLVALGTVVLMFVYAPGAAMVKCVVYLVLFVLSCMLFAPSCNAWFRQLKEIRNNPRLRKGAGGASAAPGMYGATVPGQPHDPYAPPGAIAAAPAEPVVIPPRPRSISLALALFALNLLIGIGVNIRYLPEAMAGLTALLGDGIINVVYGVVAVITILMGVLYYFIWHGSNVARWIWTAIAALSLLSTYSALKGAFAHSTQYGMVLSLSQLIALSATILLFVPVSNAWIRQVTLARNV